LTPVRRVVKNAAPARRSSRAQPADPDAPREDLILSGEVPSPIDPPSGCHFHPRCPFAMAQCSRVDTELKAAAPDHMVACHLY